jgi:hypothetical protein
MAIDIEIGESVCVRIPWLRPTDVFADIKRIEDDIVYMCFEIQNGPKIDMEAPIEQITRSPFTEMLHLNSDFKIKW